MEPSVKSFLDLLTKFFGFVDNFFWICRQILLVCRQIFLDLSTQIFGFVGKISWICRQNFFGFVDPIFRNSQQFCFGFFWQFFWGFVDEIFWICGQQIFGIVGEIFWISHCLHCFAIFFVNFQTLKCVQIIMMFKLQKCGDL